ncbi:unnamed protein product [Bodo saltans]|uniref:phospholipase D n=1 Tax=Bodo saltans TaxID=75058 RepID=A0A0S4JR31_BODSA|nr:unnamed protein product [Bodo saltans]|eukprot:CUG93976.1 unnamed protein product [Bodo saltans]
MFDFKRKFMSSFAKKVPGVPFPKDEKGLYAVTTFFHQKWYGVKPKSEMEGMLRVLSRRDTYKNNDWYRKRTPRGHKPPSEATDDTRILTGKKLRDQKYVFLAMLFNGSMRRSACELFRLPPSTDIRTLLKVMIEEKQATEAMRNYRYRPKGSPVSHKAAKTTTTPKVVDQQHEDVVSFKGYELVVPKSLTTANGYLPQYLLTDATLKPKEQQPGQPPPSQPSKLQQRWMLFPALEANVKTFVNTRDYFSDLHQSLTQLLQSTNTKRVLYIMGWMLSLDMRLAPSYEHSTLKHHITALKANGVEVRILFWQGKGYDFAKTNSKLTQEKLSRIPTFAQGIDYMYHRVKDGEFESWIFSHHQKHITILDGTNLSAYCGGSDIAAGRYDDEEKVVFHSELKPPQLDKFSTSILYGGTSNDGAVVKEKDFEEDGDPRLPWQDVQVRINGPGALDIARTFEHFFEKALTQQSLSLISRPTTFTSKASDQAGKEGDYTFCPATVTSNALVQIVHAQNRDYDFQQAMLHLIKMATKSIDIEQQFFQGRIDYANTTENRLDNYVPLAIVERILEVNNPKFRVRIVLPLIPDCFLDYNHTAVKEIMNLHHHTKQSMVDHIKIACKSDRQRFPEDLDECLEFSYLGREIDGKLYPIYVHSKVMIVDDEVCAIGSANINVFPHVLG